MYFDQSVARAPSRPTRGGASLPQRGEAGLFLAHAARHIVGDLPVDVIPQLFVELRTQVAAMKQRSRRVRQAFTVKASQSLSSVNSRICFSNDSNFSAALPPIVWEGTPPASRS